MQPDASKAIPNATNTTPETALQLVLRTVADVPNVGICISDARAADMPLVYVNRGFERITGYRAGEVLGRNCRFLQGTHANQPEARHIAEAIHEERAISIHLKNVRKNGEEFVNHLTLSPWFDANGTLAYYIGFQTDVTPMIAVRDDLRRRNQELERTVQQRTDELQEFVRELQGELNVQKRLEAQLREMNSLLETRVQERTDELRLALEKQKALGEIRARFVMTVSHEFRTPLSGITLAAGILKKFSDQFEPQERDEQLDNIREAVENLKELLDEVMFISKADANKLEFVPVRIEICSFCKDIIAQIQRIDGNNHRFVFHSPLADYTMDADEKLMRSSLTNLISNAVKYSPAGSAIEVSLAPTEDRLVLSVRDYGIGIPESDIGNLFEPFHRAGNVQRIEGTGLGLSIVKNAIERHGGTILVESALGIGTTVIVSLPRYQAK